MRNHDRSEQWNIVLGALISVLLLAVFLYCVSRFAVYRGSARSGLSICEYSELIASTGNEAAPIRLKTTYLSAMYPLESWENPGSNELLVKVTKQLRKKITAKKITAGKGGVDFVILSIFHGDLIELIFFETAKLLDTNLEPNALLNSAWRRQRNDHNSERSILVAHFAAVHSVSPEHVAVDIKSTQIPSD